MRTRLPVLSAIIAAAVVLLDQLSKHVILEQVMRPAGVTGTPFDSDRVIDVLPIFSLRLAWNTGISFSLFNSGGGSGCLALIVLELAISAGLCWYMLRVEGRWMQVAFALIVGGAFGNIIDRISFCSVVDFLDFHWGDWHFPTFNLADSCISIGVVLWLLDALGLAPHHKPAPEIHKD